VRWLRTACFWSVAILGLAGTVALATESAPDPEIAKGISEVNDGDYDGAILTLDRAVRRLASDPSKMRDLAQGYLYLGIAYAGKGHEAAARARFREAVGQMGDLSLSPDQFPPKIIDLFEAAKEEARRNAPPPAVRPTVPATAQPQVAAAPPAEKGGSKKKWLLIGGGGLVALGAAGAASRKSDNGGTTDPTGPITENWEGDLLPDNHFLRRSFGPVGAGPWQAKFNWSTEPDENPDVFVQFIVWDPNGLQMLVSRRSADRTTQAEFSGPAGRYELAIETNIPPRFRVHFTGTVTHPAP
jgi:tetratricopeptide (TPR) repeat protein